jgi:hypothetical protein
MLENRLEGIHLLIFENINDDDCVKNIVVN